MMPVPHLREIVHIDEERCDGCGLCIPSCAEGALQIVAGKARLVAEKLCDGIGNCLGTCPRGAIRIERRAAAAFDAEAVQHHVARPAAAAGAPGPAACGCPGAALRHLSPAAGHAVSAALPAPATSTLAHWPVQLHLLPVESDLWQDADVLIAADCVGFALPDLHQRLLVGKTVAVGCPKLDDVAAYVTKLAAVLARHRVRSITVAHMEVPCCHGIVTAVQQAIHRAGVADLPFIDVTVGVDGRMEGSAARI